MTPTPRHQSSTALRLLAGVAVLGTLSSIAADLREATRTDPAPRMSFAPRPFVGAAQVIEAPRSVPVPGCDAKLLGVAGAAFVDVARNELAADRLRYALAQDDGGAAREQLGRGRSTRLASGTPVRVLDLVEPLVRLEDRPVAHVEWTSEGGLTRRGWIDVDRLEVTASRRAAGLAVCELSTLTGDVPAPLYGRLDALERCVDDEARGRTDLVAAAEARGEFRWLALDQEVIVERVVLARGPSGSTACEVRSTLEVGGSPRWRGWVVVREGRVLERIGSAR